MAKASRRTEMKARGVSPVAKIAVRSGVSAPVTLAPLNFKVPREFRREFKTFASQHDMKMVELLHEGFRLVKERHRD